MITAQKNVKTWSIRQTTRMALCVALLAISARISFPLPFYPVSFSLQTFVVLLIALILPPRDAFFASAAYVGLGLCGLPFFVSGGGPSYIMQPSFGYILAFVFSTPLASWLRCRINSRWGSLFACIVATVCITVCGVGYFAAISRWALGAPIGADKAMWMGFVYLPLDTVKMIAALLMQPLLQKALGRWF